LYRINRRNPTWEFLSVPSGGWYAYAGYDGPPRDGLPGAAERLPEIDALRLDAVDKAGIDLAVLSLFQPGIQGERDTAMAIRKAKEVNDTLAERIAKHPARFRGLAAVPM
jgi:predicted TIM-barrel fold metal-dependent hydrolase